MSATSFYEMLDLETEFLPDWTKYWTAHQAEHELHGFEFKGPGVYIEGGSTLYVIPAGPRKHNVDKPILFSKDEVHSIWKKNWPEDTVFKFMIYSGRNPVRAINVLASAPVRSVDED